MPSVEAREVNIVYLGNRVLVELLMMWVDQLNVLETLVRRNQTIADDLHLWLMWHGLQIRVENTTLGVERFSVAVTLGSRIEALSELILGLWRQAGLILEDDDMLPIQDVLDQEEIVVYRNWSAPGHCSICHIFEYLPGGYRSTECSNMNLHSTLSSTLP